MVFEMGAHHSPGLRHPGKTSCFLCLLEKKKKNGGCGYFGRVKNRKGLLDLEIQRSFVSFVRAV